MSQTLRDRPFRWRQHAEALARDLRYTARGLRRAPGFAAAAIATIALGTGATAAVFAVVSAVLLRPLPYPDASRLALVWATDAEGARTWLSAPEIDDLRRRATTIDQVAGLSDLRLGLTGTGAPEELQVVAASASLFGMLGATPAAGRLLSDDDDREHAPLSVVLGYGLWQRRFGGSPAVVGSRILLDGRAYTVAGVLGPLFSLLPPSSVFPARADAWVALQAHLPMTARDVRYLHAVARVRPGVTIGAARQELAAIGAALSRDYPSVYGGRSWGFEIVRMQDDLVRHIRPALLVLFATVVLVLLIACANVAALLLARGASRRREMAVRAALGASRSRILAQLLTEGAVLALVGGAAGLALAAAAPALSAAPALAALPRFSEVSIDWRVFAFALLMAVATSLVFALAPAVELSALSSRLGGARVTRATGAGRILAGVEIALASLVLVVALLLARSFARVLAADPGFDPAGVVSMRIALPPKYRGAEDVVRFYDTALDQARRIPGIDSVAAVTQLPLSGAMLGSSFTVDARRADADLRGVTPDYFAVMRIPLVEGRGFTAADRADTPQVAVIDETLARRLWPRGAVGQRMRWIRRPDADVEIVGVVRGVRHRGLDQPVEATVYRPHTQYARSTMVIVARAHDGLDAAAPPARRRGGAVGRSGSTGCRRSHARQPARAIARAARLRRRPRRRARYPRAVADGGRRLWSLRVRGRAADTRAGSPSCAWRHPARGRPPDPGRGSPRRARRPRSRTGGRAARDAVDSEPASGHRAVRFRDAGSRGRDYALGGTRRLLDSRPPRRAPRSINRPQERVSCR